MQAVYRRDESAARPIAGSDRSPKPPSRPEARVFQSLTVSAARTLVARRAREAGMDSAAANDLVLAVNEIATNSVRHGEGWGTLRIWREGDRLVCEIADRGRPGCVDTLRRSRGPDDVGGHGLWLAERLCERVEIEPGRDGTVVRLHATLKDARQAV